VAPATLVGRDPNTDLAVLRIQADTIPPVWSDSDDLKVGHLVLALGRPSEQVEATLGVVSKLREAQTEGQKAKRVRIEMRGPGGPGAHEHGPGSGRRGRRMWMHALEEGDVLRFIGDLGPVIKTDVVMYPGFSGGPLVDAGGAVRGLNTSALAQGSGIAIPTATVRRVVESLLSHGKIRRGYLGIGAQPVRLPAALAEELDQEVGLMVVSVETDSPAEKSGILLGDIVVGLDDYTVQSVGELLMLLGTDKVGAESVVRLVRGGQLMDVAVTIGERE
jgi:S1-C subfamily serine protease